MRNSPLVSVKRISSNGTRDDGLNVHVTCPLSPESLSIIENDNIREFIVVDSFKKTSTEFECMSISCGYMSIIGALSFSSSI